jgi:hypothetical protein
MRHMKEGSIVDRLVKVMVCLLVMIGCLFGVATAHDAYVWHQIEKQAYAADMVDGAQE